MVLPEKKKSGLKRGPVPKWKPPRIRKYKLYPRRDGQPRISTTEMRKAVHNMLSHHSFIGLPAPSNLQIARQVGRSVSCIKKVVAGWIDPFHHEFMEHRGGYWTPEQHVERRIITPAMEVKIEEWMQAREGDLANDIRAKLMAHFHLPKLSVITVNRCLKRLGWRCGRPIYRPLLTQAQKDERVRWAKAHLEQDWSMVCLLLHSHTHTHTHTHVGVGAICIYTTIQTRQRRSLTLLWPCR